MRSARLPMKSPGFGRSGRTFRGRRWPNRALPPSRKECASSGRPATWPGWAAGSTRCSCSGGGSRTARAIRLGPTDPAGHFQLGLALLRRGRTAAAADAFREALRLSPDHPDALYYLGEALEAQGDLPAALRTLERTATLFPEDPRTYKLMGRLLDRMGRSEEAMAMHRKAREASIR